VEQDEGLPPVPRTKARNALWSGCLLVIRVSVPTIVLRELSLSLLACDGCLLPVAPGPSLAKAELPNCLPVRPHWASDAALLRVGNTSGHG
jgi:hypothetical protein